MDSSYDADVWIAALSEERLQPGHRLTFKDVPFFLGKYFCPADWPRLLRSGNIRASHLYCDLDYLHASDTIAEAAQQTSQRRRTRSGS